MRPELQLLDAPWDLQEKNWNEWNAAHRVGTPDTYMLQLRDEAQRWASQSGKKARILEVGCGTGWLAADLTQFGSVLGVDLSPTAIEIAERRRSAAKFICGNFSELELEKGFDFVVTADTISHVADQDAFIRRIGELLRPNGTLLLLSQNEFVLGRTSFVAPPGPGYIRHWPSRAKIRSMLSDQFTIIYESTIGELGGDQGFLRLVRSKRLWRPLSRVLGDRRTQYFYGKLGFGSELVTVARRSA